MSLNTSKKKMVPMKQKVKSIHKDKEPDFMVQVNEPRMLRKDILESIREIIIFMQGYEKFRKIQEEKVTLFTTLKTEVRTLNNLIDDKLRKYLPKGKLKAVDIDSMPETEQEENKEEVASEKPLPASTERETASGLDELESQLKEIEGQLKNIN